MAGHEALAKIPEVSAVKGFVGISRGTLNEICNGQNLREAAANAQNKERA